jgi:pyruvate kinase
MTGDPREAGPRIVATLGPASFDLASALAEAGATAFRLNASHMSPGELEDVLGRVRASLQRLPVVVDLQGAKMRLGKFEKRVVQRGERLRFVHNFEAKDALPLPHPELFRVVTVGETLSCDDDRLRFIVRVAGSEVIEAEALNTGELLPRKGINLVDHPVALEDLTPRDVQHIERAVEYPPVSFACSFVRDGSEAGWIRSRAIGCPVVGKVERRAAIERIESIASQVEEIWICRGDLGSQLGMVELAHWVGDFRPAGLKVPVLMAGQVLEHLTSHPEPTRSEVCHLCDLVQRGYAGIVLSDETAIGADPVNAVKTARSLLRAFGLSR